MERQRSRIRGRNRLWISTCFVGMLAALAGCRSAATQVVQSAPPVVTADTSVTITADTPNDATTEIEPAQHEVPIANSTAISPVGAISLVELEQVAVTQNPALQKLQHETAAAWAKTRYVDKLPDPTIGASVFAHPIETAAGSQRANLTVMQMIPWLERLDSQTQQSTYEALAVQQMYEAERLKVIGDLRTGWARLYILGRQSDLLKANRELLKSLSEVASARLEQNLGTAGDVIMVTLEISRIDEQLYTVQQQILSTIAEMNRLTGQPAETALAIPDSLDDQLPEWSFDMLRTLAWERQPEIAAAHLRTNASRWGVEVARLKRRPDVTVGATWFGIEGNRPPSSVVDVGRDAWSLGAQISIPLGTEKYNAIQQEANSLHYASHASVQVTQQRYEAILRDLIEQARAQSETLVLYRDSILPQAKQVLSSDQQALANGTVDFERVVDDVRRLLVLEFGYHRALGQLAMARAKIQQTVGTDLDGTFN